MKSFIKAASFLAIVSLLAPVMIFAQNDPTGVYTPPTQGLPQNTSALFNILDRVVNWVFAVIIVLSIMFIILASFEFVTGGPEKAADARQKLIWAAVGIGFALIARAMPTVLRAFLGVS